MLTEQLVGQRGNLLCLCDEWRNHFFFKKEMLNNTELDGRIIEVRYDRHDP